MSRRGILAVGAGAVGAAVLAACSGGSSGSRDTGSGESGGDGGSGSVTTPSGSSASSSAASSAAGASSAASPAGDALVALDALPVGTSKSVKLANGKPAIVTRTGTSSAVCFSAICTHQGCTVKPKGKQFDCPCHGSSYDATTGKVLGGPAPSPLPKIEVTVTDGRVTQTG